MPVTHTHKAYPNYVLETEIKDQLDTRLDLNRFCITDNSLVGNPGEIKRIRVYSATDGTEKLEMGSGNSQNIEVTYNDKDYKILLAQNRFAWYDEEEMIDPMILKTGMKHAAVDLYNTITDDIYKEFVKATQTVSAAAFTFDAFVDCASELNLENLTEQEIFALVNPKDMGAIRKALKDSLQYNESYVRSGYVGTVAGINLYTTKVATVGTVVGGTRDAVTVFHKTGVQVEQDRDPNVRLNEMFTRKYYLAAITDQTKAFKLTVGA